MNEQSDDRKGEEKGLSGCRGLDGRTRKIIELEIPRQERGIKREDTDREESA